MSVDVVLFSLNCSFSFNSNLTRLFLLVYDSEHKVQSNPDDEIFF